MDLTKVIQQPVPELGTELYFYINFKISKLQSRCK